MVDLSLPKLVFLVGQPDSGKTNAVRYIVIDKFLDRKADPFQFGLIFTKTPEDYSFWDKKYIFDDYDEDKLRNYWDKLPNRTSPPNCIIFDDFMGEAQINTPFFKSFIARHRHKNCSIIISAQDLIQGANMIFRRNINYLICFDLDDEDILKTLYKKFASNPECFDNFKEFMIFFKKCTEKEYYAFFYTRMKGVKDWDKYKAIKFPNSYIPENDKLKFNFSNNKNNSNNIKSNKPDSNNGNQSQHTNGFGLFK